MSLFLPVCGVFVSWTIENIARIESEALRGLRKTAGVIRKVFTFTGVTRQGEDFVAKTPSI